MNKTVLLILLLLTLIFAAEKPDGGYASWEDFENGKVTYSLEKFKIIERGYQNNDAVAIQCNQANGKAKKWHTSKHGNLAIIKDGRKYYLFTPSVKLHYYQNYSWYTIVSNSTNFGAPGMKGVPSTNTSNYILDMKTKKSIKLSVKSLRVLLADTPQLLQQFNSEKKKKHQLFSYLQKYLTQTN